MPTYQYVCKNCRHEFEELQTMKEAPLVTCPSCGFDTLARAVGSGSGVIFKGSGFYLTDYVKNAGKKAGSTASKPADDTKASSGSETATTSEARKETLPAPDAKKE